MIQYHLQPNTQSLVHMRPNTTKPNQIQCKLRLESQQHAYYDTGHGGG